jgi:hypothetical protein
LYFDYRRASQAANLTLVEFQALVRVFEADYPDT